MTTRFTRILRTSALLVIAGLVVATPALAHQGGKGNSGHSDKHDKHDKHDKPAKPAKPTIDFSTPIVGPDIAASTALTAAGGTDVREMKLEAHKKGTRLVVEVGTPTGVTEVKLSLTGAVLGMHSHGDGHHLPIATVPAGSSWATYAAAAPAGSSVFKISIEHSSKKNTDVVKVEYYASNGKKAKKGKVLLHLDGSPIA